MTTDVRTMPNTHVARPEAAPSVRRRERDNAVTFAMALLIALSVVFLKWPQIDLAVSQWFYTPGLGFTLKDDPVLHGLRLSGRFMTFAVALSCLALLVASRFLPRAQRGLRPSGCLFMLVALATGPGLLVNGVLKTYWGRARPRHTMDFGGEFPFTPAWLDPDHCVRNCSFVSGEAAAAFWLVGIGFAVPPRFRATAMALTLPYAAALSLNRIAAGGHYFSDVLIAWAIMLILLIVLAGAILSPSRAAALDGLLARPAGAAGHARRREA